MNQYPCRLCAPGACVLVIINTAFKAFKNLFQDIFLHTLHKCKMSTYPARRIEEQINSLSQKESTRKGKKKLEQKCLGNRKTRFARRMCWYFALVKQLLSTVHIHVGCDRDTETHLSRCKGRRFPIKAAHHILISP